VLTLAQLPRYLILEAESSVRLEVGLVRPACEIDIGLETPKPGRSFLLLIGPEGGPMVQRMRVTGRARILFEPRDSRPHVLMLANPLKEPLVLCLGGHLSRGRPEGTGSSRGRPSPSSRSTPVRAISRRRSRLRPPTATAFSASVSQASPLGVYPRRARPKA
jgi:hypothetical protein